VSIAVPRRKIDAIMLQDQGRVLARKNGSPRSGIAIKNFDGSMPQDRIEEFLGRVLRGFLFLM